MTSLATKDGGDRRRSNFLRDVAREPEANIAHDALEAQALNLVRASLEADALSNRRDLRPADMDRMLSVAKGKLRGMSERELRGISASSGSLKTLTDYSLSAATVIDPRSPAALALAAERDGAAGADNSISITARLLRADLDRAERAASSARFDGMSSGDRLSYAELQNIAGARAAAAQYGMSWALNNPELLKLGAGAIKTLHDAGVRRETFERMTSDRVGIRAETVVNFAGWAKRHSLTPEQTNNLMNSTSELHENLTKDLAAEERKKAQRDLDQALNKYVTGPNTPEARRELEEQRMKHARTDEQRDQIRAKTKELEVVARQTQAKVAKAVGAQTQAIATETQTKADRQVALAGFDDAPAPPATTQRVGADPATQPDKAKTAKQITPPVKTAAVADDKKPAAKGSAPKVG